MSFQITYNPVVSVSALLLLVLVGVGPTSSAFSQSPTQEKITIELLPDSSPRYYECNVTPTNGTSFIEGFNSQESAYNVLTDGNSNTGIMGDARFSVHFDEPLFDHPGPELSVTELSGAESFNASVDVPNMGKNSISVFPQLVNATNSCNYLINEALIDLQDFGIPQGSSVSSITFDNLGEEDSLTGADIGDISILESDVNNNGTSSLNGSLNLA